jgi:hypothetical protein
MKTLRAAALLVALALPLATAGTAKAQEDSSAVTTIYESVLSGVTGSVTSEGIGWAMSAIGLAGGSGPSLSTINADLLEIDQELTDINSTLTQILNAIDNQTCVGTETQASLTEAVDNITNLFGEYQTEFIEPSQMGNPIIQSQLDDWMSAVLDQSSGIAANLTAINDALYANPSSALLECIQSITQNYTSGTGPSENIIDDRPYYTPILNTINYYYGAQTEGASILVEALHLEACEEAAKSDPDLQCNFSTASTSTPPAKAYEICDNPTGTVATYCTEATEVVTDVESGTGLYQQVLAQMIYAGAPYSRYLLGLLWTTSYVFPKNLVDFTNEATVNGQTQSNCASLTSADPCGFLVGAYDLTFDAKLTYAGYPGDGESSVWAPADAGQLLTLLTPYNDKSTAGNINSSGTLAAYLKSIGFIKSGGNGWIVTTKNTGKNDDTGSEAICFMDTSASRDNAAQPWCDGISGEVQGTDNLLTLKGLDWYEQAKYTEDLASNPSFIRRITTRAGARNNRAGS